MTLWLTNNENLYEIKGKVQCLNGIRNGTYKNIVMDDIRRKMCITVKYALFFMYRHRFKNMQCIKIEDNHSFEIDCFDNNS